MKVNVNQKLALFSFARLSIHAVPDTIVVFKKLFFFFFLDYWAGYAYYLKYWEYFP